LTFNKPQISALSLTLDTSTLAYFWEPFAWGEDRFFQNEVDDTMM
jgi:hypothetical protein